MSIQTLRMAAWLEARTQLGEELWCNLALTRAEQKVIMNTKEFLTDKDWNELVEVYGEQRSNVAKSKESAQEG